MAQGRVAVAMSGGVDSSMAAALLQQAGYEVLGITMQIWPADEPARERDGFRSCCGAEAIEAARKTANKLSIPHFVMNLRDVFARQVITDFCQEYSRGRTPNPCIRCNQYVKFDALLTRVKELDADFLATGHYARVEHSGDGYQLLKGFDPTKDQSYFLYTLGQQELQNLLLPIGDYHKEAVREMAAKLDLPTAGRPASQDICFIPDNDYRSFIGDYVQPEPGDIVDTEGNVLGKHQGLARYTVGQRQGLGLSSTTRLYVLKLDTINNELVAGTGDQLFTSRLLAANLNWVSGYPPADTAGITARVRNKASEVPVTLQVNDNDARVDFHQPQRAISPGQSVVFYQGEAVLGGGIIEDVRCTANPIVC
ncbi:tRNA 2-thiouridine(34) synthase MnmA [Chloroflexota bacterium]